MFIGKGSIWRGLGRNSHDRVRVVAVHKRGDDTNVVAARLILPGGWFNMPYEDFTSAYILEEHAGEVERGSAHVPPPENAKRRAKICVWDPDQKRMVIV